MSGTIKCRKKLHLNNLVASSGTPLQNRLLRESPKTICPNNALETDNGLRENEGTGKTRWITWAIRMLITSVPKGRNR